MGDPDRDFNGGNLRKPLQGFDFLHLESQDPGRNHRTGIASFICSSRYAPSDVEVNDSKNCQANLSGGLLSDQGESDPRCLPGCDARLFGQSPG